MLKERVMAFARAELSRYAALMDPRYNASQVEMIPFAEAELLANGVRDPYWDDAYRIDVINGRGVIAYSNPRSALLGVYRLLHEAGCAFLRPGSLGEIIPRRPLDALTVHVEMRAGYRHRCVCIEGSVSLENVLDMIDFAPKVGYNAYFTQFMEAYTFFERWYTHKGNPLRAAESFSPSLSREMLAAAVEAIQKRGLLYHAVGHGWTCEPLGIPGLHWEDDGIELASEQRECMAQVDGTRGLYRGIALNTNLCYSNPRVRGLMARAIARYAAEHPEIDVLHVWLADDFNNQCECPACQTARPSDFYVMLLNEVDDLLTRQGIPVRIAFLLYFDLLFPPERERLKNPDRFLLMYAPITRSFARSFEGVQPSEDLPAYRRNRLSFGSSLSGNLGYLKAWQRVFHGDSFDFDYHLCSVAYSDPAQMTIGRVLHSDIRALRALGLNGMANCQIQRIFMPHGFSFYLAGQTLCDPSADYLQCRSAYFEACFGEEYQAALQLLEEYSARFPMELYAQDHPEPSEEAARCLEGLQPLLRGFCPPGRSGLHPAQERSWALMDFWRDLNLRLCDYLIPFSRREKALWEPAWRELQRFAWQNEPRMQGEFDAYCFLEHYRRQQP